MLKTFFKCAICDTVDDVFTLSKMVINCLCCLIDKRCYEAVLQASYVTDIICPAAPHIPVNIRFLLGILDEYHVLTDVKNMGERRQKNSFNQFFFFNSLVLQAHTIDVHTSVVYGNDFNIAIPQTQDLTDTCVIISGFGRKTNAEDDHVVSWLSWPALGFALKNIKREQEYG